MFAYCLNNPVNAADPTGHSSSTDANGNGIPDYLEKRWKEQTKRAKAKDITNEFNSIMNAHATELSDYYKRYYNLYSSVYNEDAYTKAFAATAAYFIEKEKTGGDWDLKNGTYPYDMYFKYNGGTYSGQDLGNIHFGYVGIEIFTPNFLHFGAGLYQVYSGSRWSYYPYLFDEPRDYKMIDLGIQLNS